MAWQTDIWYQHPEQRKAASWLDNLGEDALADCLPLNRLDLLGIGTIVQVMATSDSHARRAIEVFDTAMGRERRESKKDYRDADVCKEVRLRLTAAPFDLRFRSRGDEIMAFLDQVASYRHMAAHWPGRRVPMTNCLVFLTKNSREALRKSGAGLDLYEMRYAVIYRPQFFELIDEAKRAVDEFGSILTAWIDDMDLHGLLPPLPAEKS